MDPEVGVSVEKPTPHGVQTMIYQNNRVKDDHLKSLEPTEESKVGETGKIRLNCHKDNHLFCNTQYP